MITTYRRVPIWRGISEDDVGRTAGTTQITLANEADEEYQVDGVSVTLRARGSDPVTIYKDSDGVVTYVNNTMPQSYCTAYARVNVLRTVTLDHAMIEFDVRLKNLDNYFATFANYLSVYSTSFYADLYVYFLGWSDFFRDAGDFGLMLRPLNNRIWAYAHDRKNQNTASPMPEKFMQGEWTHVRAYRRTVNGTLYSVLEVEGKTLLSSVSTQSGDLDVYFIGTGGFGGGYGASAYTQFPYIEISKLQVTALVAAELDDSVKQVGLALGD